MTRGPSIEGHNPVTLVTCVLLGRRDRPRGPRLTAVATTPTTATELALALRGSARVKVRRHRLDLFATAYGLTSTAGLIDAVIDVQREWLRQVSRLASLEHQPRAGWVADGILDTAAGRAVWSQSNRRLFE